MINMSREEIQAEEEQKKAEIKKAVKEANGLILNDGPFQSLKKDDAWEIQTLKSLAADEIHVSEDWDFLSKALRVYYTCPLKFDLTRTPEGKLLPEGETLSREDFPAVGPAPVGKETTFTQAIRDFVPTFEKIPDEELDTRFKAFDNALIKKILDKADKNNTRTFGWRSIMRNVLSEDPPELLSSEARENETKGLFWERVFLPNDSISRYVGLDVKYVRTPGIPSLRPDYVVELGGAACAQQLELRPGAEPISKFESPAHETLLICECKQRGLSRMLKNGEIAYIERSLLKECLLYMLGYKTDVVLLTDFETSILLELNFPDGQETRKRKFDEEGTRTRLKTRLAQEKDLEFPLRYRVIDIEDTKYTLQAVLASTSYSKLNEEAEERRKDQVTALDERFAKTEEEFLEADKQEEGLDEDLEEDLDEDSDEGLEEDLDEGLEEDLDEGLVLAQISRQKRSTYRDINLKGVKFTVLQEGYDYWTQVFRFNNNVVPLVFPWLEKDIQGDAVLKIYDAWRLKTFYEDYAWEIAVFSNELCDYLMGRAALEMECYLRIREHNSKKTRKINSPQLYDYGNMYIRREKDVLLGPVLHRGPYLLMEYMHGTGDVVPASLIEEDGVRQLKLLHSIGIEHGDVDPKNYFTSKEGVHFFDFSHARLYPGEVPQRKAESEIEKFKVKLKEQDLDSS